MLSDTNPSVRIEAVKRILQDRVMVKKMETIFPFTKN